jgi:alkylhydroperoxidase family enzyme
MPFVKLVDPRDTAADVRATFEEGGRLYGKVLDAWRMIAHKPEAFVAYFPFVRSIFAPGELDQRIKELTAVRITLLNHCRYSLTHRLYSARNYGISEEDLLGLIDVDEDRYSEAELAALAFAEELTTRVDDVTFRENPQGVSAETLERIRARFSDTEIVELALSVSLWNMLTRLFRVMDLDMDMAIPPPEMDAAL